MRIVIAEDSALLREGLVALLESAGHLVVARTSTADDAVRAVSSTDPDVLVLDVRMPDGDEGIRAAVAIRDRNPQQPIMLLPQYVEPRGAAQLLAQPGTGYLLKDRVLDVAGFLDALERIVDGGTALDSQVVAALLDTTGRSGPLDRLSSRELEVLGLMAEGMSNTALSHRLVLSERTVESHISSIFLKLNLDEDTDVHRRVRAVVAYLRSQKT
ncbi:response regulator transcription factor [Glutamicibacter protophormiae]|uniref:response regulator transcription factor n=1 Tax=Glutamicibacter protophormiae TaxID=37930 RepID=UPI00195A29FC|nr:response regulator transcription factor [Glutamicibacter protophormiae]QRQ79971.1 response regulator transcription factor [Glutamicibacter protophormiae]